MRHSLLVGARLAWLAAEMSLAAGSFIFCVLFRSPIVRRRARARWLQRGCRRVLRILNVEIRTAGPVPKDGLLVSNHLSYLDILVLSALTPSIFIAKLNVRRWPIFGCLAQMGGTVFVNRELRMNVGPAVDAMRNMIKEGSLVALFPEGTSSNGHTVLPFKSALLEPAMDPCHSLFACYLQYELRDGDVTEEVCYWKDMTLVPHLVNLLSKKRVNVSVRFSQFRGRRTDRKELARQLRDQVLSLKESGFAC